MKNKSFSHFKEGMHDLRTVTMIALSYAGFLRYNELVHIRRCDIFCASQAHAKPCLFTLWFCQL